MPPTDIPNTDSKSSQEPKGESPAKSRAAAIFFDWDDTLLSSSVLWRMGYRLDSELDMTDLQLHQQLRDLETSVISVLKKAATYGKVHIVTNGETGWVQRSAEKFIPAVVPFLTSIDILSARSTFEAQYPDDPLKWKVYAFESRLKIFANDSQSKFDVISFGDSHVEREAIRIATRSLGEARTKSVKFAERPSMEQLRRQIELINNCFHYIHGHDGDLDLQLTITEHNPQSQSPPSSPSSSSPTSATSSSSSTSTTSSSEPEKRPASTRSASAPKSCAQEHSSTSNNQSEQLAQTPMNS